MNRWIRRGAIAAAAVVVLGAAALAGAVALGERKRERQVAVDVAPLAYRSDAAALERGRYLYLSRGCVDCHGANGAGRSFAEGGGLKLAGPNISPGAGSVVAGYKPEDWVRTLRHGVKPDGRPLLVMPSEDYARFTDADLASLIAYVRQLAPAAGGPGVIELPLPARAAYGLGLIRDAAEKIDHRLPPPEPVPEAVSVAHGAYVANMCIGCHGAELKGGKIPGGPPDWPAASDLTGPVMQRYADGAALAAMFRSGKRPDGSAVQVMPFESLRAMSEVDVGALHLYLRSRAGAAP